MMSNMLKICSHYNKDKDIHAAILAEREACATLCESLADTMFKESSDAGLPFGELVPDGCTAVKRAAYEIRNRK